MLGVTDEMRTLKLKLMFNVLQRCHLTLLQTCATLDDESRSQRQVSAWAETCLCHSP